MTVIKRRGCKRRYGGLTPEEYFEENETKREWE